MRLRSLIGIIFLFQLILVNGQDSSVIKTSNADSLHQLLSTLTGAEKIDTLNRIAFRVVNHHPDSCKKLATLTISMSDSLNYKKGLADGYYLLGNSFIMRDSLYPAMSNYLNALRIYEQLD
ncbi:MAG: hypothetical protein HQ542_10955, partial [Bacteroidia bacterium]|nr:hypothetical protein [Bacteroidia bacterium]